MNRTASLVVRNLLFTIVVPGLGGVLAPWWILAGGGHASHPVAWAAVSLIVAGAVMYAWCVWNFAAVGRGTPGPWDAPRRVVATGPYRWVRNPIYIAALAIVGSEAWLFMSLRLLIYAGVMAACFHLFVVGYEERALRRRFDGSYEQYRRNVPRWIPRPPRPRGQPDQKGAAMARIAGVPAREAGLYGRVAYYFTRRFMTRLTGRAPEGMLAPLEMYAHVPGLLRGYAGLEQASGKLQRVDKRLRALAELKAATITRCEYCIDMGSAISRRWGLTDAELLALPNYRTSELFSDLDKLVIDYAAGMSRTPVEVPDELFAKLREHFDDAQIVELTHLIALENLRGRFNLALGIGAAGFSEGMVCAIPDGA